MPGGMGKKSIMPEWEGQEFGAFWEGGAVEGGAAGAELFISLIFQVSDIVPLHPLWK